ncbi:hypothetical protein ANO11243_018630 [Dothideomycetidae sp. 11243]|nr:hypothetical protein ANO11243_018630 [fungal sp. No.11243]
MLRLIRNGLDGNASMKKRKAKGYPDLASRHLLHRLSTPSPWNNFRHVPVLALTDFDPDGIAIYNTFKSGSKALAYEGPEIVTPHMTRLGLGCADLARIIGTGRDQVLMRLTKRDRRKAQLMLGQECGRDLVVRRELQVMLMLNVKAELQILDERGGPLAHFGSALPYGNVTAGGTRGLLKLQSP